MILDPKMILRIALTLAVAAGISCALTPVIKVLARKIGAMDVPKDGRRMHDHAIRLVDDQHVRVLIDDVQRNGLRDQRDRLRLRERQTVDCARRRFCVFPDRLPAAGHKPLLQQALHRAARHPGTLGQKDVEPLAVLFGNQIHGDTSFVFLQYSTADGEYQTESSNSFRQSAKNTAEASACSSVFPAAPTSSRMECGVRC